MLLACPPVAKVGFRLHRGTLDHNVYVAKSCPHGDVYQVSFYLLLISLSTYSQHDKEPKVFSEAKRGMSSYPILGSSSTVFIQHLKTKRNPTMNTGRIPKKPESLIDILVARIEWDLSLCTTSIDLMDNTHTRMHAPARTQHTHTHIW